MSIIAPYDREALRAAYQSAVPFPFMKIDNFLLPAVADEAAQSYRSFDEAKKLGREFKAVNENKKVQIVDPTKFPPVMTRIADALASQQFIDDLGYITGIDKLQWDPTYSGGGIHQTAKSGWLDVHVDFNFNDNLQYHRRLNILIYFNPVWEERWGGLLELWDKEVRERHHAFVPAHNRCVVFTTSDISYHGVTAVDCPDGMQRCSFAAYYYTKEPPVGWDGTKHDTIFKARPEEFMKRNVLMPAEHAKRAAEEGVRSLKKGIKSILGRE
jgi:Rps23 Pro-64 3,4-dihydroxylase Tpa1-like proline 4-hydroxylase